MRLLIDTHTFIWYTAKNAKLSLDASDLIASAGSDIVLSIVSLWEMSIKVALRRLEIEGGLENLLEVLTRYDMEILPIAFDHTVRQSLLPFHHNDPFDRMIAAQALIEKIDLVSIDEVFDRYFEGSEVNRLW